MYFLGGEEKKYVEEKHTGSGSCGCCHDCSNCLFCLTLERKSGRCCADHLLLGRIRNGPHLQLPRHCGQLHLRIYPIVDLAHVLLRTCAHLYKRIFGEERRRSMFKKATLGAVFAVAGMFAVTAYFVSPSSAKADDAAPITTYSAGSANGPICSCPADPGNCICAITQ
jgi:hypothetical protein